MPGVGAQGDGGSALQAQFFQPVAVAVDGSGNVFIADQGNNRVRKVTRGGIITTFAGTGAQGYSGDGGPATLAQFNGGIQAVTTDSAGRVYIGECYGTGNNTPPNNRVRVVDLNGNIRSLASGFGCIIGLTLDNAGNVYASGAQVAGSPGIFKITPSGTVTRVAAISGVGIAYDSRSGILYVAETDKHQIRAIAASGTVTTVAGTGTAGFGGDGGPASLASLRYPSGIALDGAGNLYVADAGNFRLRMITPAGLIATVGGTGLQISPFIGGGVRGDGGPALLASMVPQGAIAVDSTGSVVFPEANGSGNDVRALVPSTSTAGCMYSVVPAELDLPVGGGTSSATLTAAQNSCPWLAFSTVDWLDVTSGNVGTGNATIAVKASSNPKAATRNAVVAVAGKVITVSQGGVACTLAINPSQVAAPASGLGGTVTVTANVTDCQWTASSDSPWLFVITGSTGQGSGSVTFSAATNSGPARSGILTIAGQTVTVTQAAAPGVISTLVSIIGSSATGTGPFAPNQLISLYGTKLGPSPGISAQIGTDGTIARSLAGTRVLFDGVAAPILYAGANQVNTVVPCSTGGKASTQMVVQFQGIESPPVTLSLSTAAPGIFSADGSGKGQAAALNQDYSINGPMNPVPRGSAITIYATGIGATSPCVDGQTYQSDFPRPTVPIVVGIGNVGAQLLYAGQAPLFISGVAQINVTIPPDAPTGLVPLTLFVDGVFSPSGVTIAVK